MAARKGSTKGTTESKPRAKRTSKVDPNETKEQKFARLATARTQKALKGINNLIPLTGSNYKYTSEQAVKITAALTEAVDNLSAKFAGGGKDAAPFTL
jgi:hypothetical protein